MIQYIMYIDIYIYIYTMLGPCYHIHIISHEVSITEHGCPRKRSGACCLRKNLVRSHSWDLGGWDEVKTYTTDGNVKVTSSETWCKEWAPKLSTWLSWLDCSSCEFVNPFMNLLASICLNALKLIIAYVTCAALHSVDPADASNQPFRLDNIT